MNILDNYDYQFPEELIAQEPANPRDSAKLLVYKRRTKQVQFDTFKNIVTYLPKDAVVVFNQTKVIPARFYVKKPTGGKIELLYIGIEKALIKVISKKELKLKTKLQLAEYFLQVEKQEGQFFFLHPSFPIHQTFTILEQYGHTPIPPYIKHTTLSEKDLRQQYQTVFAKTVGSVAAPTASLHFTEELMKEIKESGHEIYFVTLHVGLGTFAPVTKENIEKKQLHQEFYEISPEVASSLNNAKQQDKKIIAVGTTVVRTLESASNEQHELIHLSGTTDLFIQEDYTMKFVDDLITNFHVPRSSLMMLVSSMVGRKKLLELYQQAIEKKFRLFSFGDGMLLC